MPTDWWAGLGCTVNKYIISYHIKWAAAVLWLSALVKRTQITTAATKWKWNVKVVVRARSKKQDPAASILREIRDKISNQYREPTVIPAPHNVLLFILKYWFFVTGEANDETAQNCKGSYSLLHPKYRRTPHILINWYGEPSGYAENPDNWIFLWK